jgi:hypothetical protein
MIMSSGPSEFPKAESDLHRDYRKMEWGTFLILREWAQEVADYEGYPVYLVGSVLMREYPRDLDIVMIMPLADFEKEFGSPPENEDNMVGYSAVATQQWHNKTGYWATIQQRVRWITRIDVKVMPDTWFTRWDKLLLAEPKGKVFVRGWDMYKRQPPEDYSI